MWMQPKVKPNGDKYLEYPCATWGTSCSAHEPQAIMDYLASIYTLKKESVKEPNFCLFHKVKQWTIDGGDNPARVHWAVAVVQYISERRC
jgi:hypothetical protein